jgi:hypothetical protein
MRLCPFPRLTLPALPGQVGDRGAQRLEHLFDERRHLQQVALVSRSTRPVLVEGGDQDVGGEAVVLVAAGVVVVELDLDLDEVARPSRRCR